MHRASVTVVNRLGLHARAAARVVRLAAQFESRITLVDPLSDSTADARSILDILSLSASSGRRVDIVVEGADEEAAADAMKLFFRSGFDEN